MVDAENETLQCQQKFIKYPHTQILGFGDGVYDLLDKSPWHHIPKAAPLSLEELSVDVGCLSSLLVLQSSRRDQIQGKECPA